MFWHICIAHFLIFSSFILFFEIFLINFWKTFWLWDSFFLSELWFTYLCRFFFENFVVKWKRDDNEFDKKNMKLSNKQANWFFFVSTEKSFFLWLTTRVFMGKRLRGLLIEYFFNSRMSKGTFLEFLVIDFRTSKEFLRKIF